MKTNKAASDEPLPVETSPIKKDPNTENNDIKSGNVETNVPDSLTEHVATDKDYMTQQVETSDCMQNTVHVETSSQCEISTHPSALVTVDVNQPTNVTTTLVDTPNINVSVPQSPKATDSDAEQSASVETTLTDPANTGDNGTVREAADSSINIEKDTSTRNPTLPETPAAYLDDEVKTDAYSDDETIPNIDEDTQIPDITGNANDTGNDTTDNAQIPANNGNHIDAGNDTVENSTDSPNMTAKLVESFSKSVVLKIQPLKDIEIDIWSNTVRHYYKFNVAQDPPNLENASALLTNDESEEYAVSLRGRNDVDYTPMLTSDLDSEPDTDKKKPKKYRPRASGPSAQRQLANKCTKLSKTDLGMNPLHSYPIRGYKQLAKTATETTDIPLPVKTELSVDTESPQVETTNSPEHVKTNDSTSHVETGSPKKGTLVTHSFELKKYKRP